MSKTQAIEWGAFFNGEVVTKEVRNLGGRIAKVASATHLALMPTAAFAATAAGDSATWITLFQTALSIADWLCVGIIIYAGVTWMFGNRTRGIDLVLSGSSGYIIIRHAIDIRNWLRTL